MQASTSPGPTTWAPTSASSGRSASDKTLVKVDESTPTRPRQLTGSSHETNSSSGNVSSVRATPATSGEKKPRQSRTPSATFNITQDDNGPGNVNMAHCQLKGPLMGPLRDRRRADIASDHPVWKSTRQFQADLMTLTQQIRRTPGIPANLAETICETLTSQSQQINNAIRETVDDASEIRIQIEEANHALMTLKVQGTAAENDLCQMEKRVKEQSDRAEENEDRLAKYHNDAEKDRNEIRECLALLHEAGTDEGKAGHIKELILMCQKQVSVSHTIWVEPVKKPTEYEAALAAVKEANPGFIPDSPVNDKPIIVREPMNPFDAGKYDPPKRSTSFGSPVAPPLRDGFRGLMQNNHAGPRNDQGSGSLGHRSNGFTNGGSGGFRPVTPHDRMEVTSPSTGAAGSFSSVSGRAAKATPHRPGTSLGHRMNGGFHPAANDLRAKAPEFHPGDVDAFSNQLASMQLGRGFGDGQNHHAGPRPVSRAGNSQAMVPFASNDARVGAGLRGPGFFGNGPSRPHYVGNQYDNRLVVNRTQPGIPLGQTFSGMDDDLSRFSASFHELFSMARSFIATWVGDNTGQIDRTAPVMQYLPKCYSGFTEHQAWSYVRQHLLDSLSRSCLFARVIVDFICDRIMVPSAWQGFDFQSDRRIQQLEAEKARGPIVTGGGRNAYGTAVSDVINSIINNDRYENYRDTRIGYFSMELENMLGPLVSQYANLEEAHRDMRAMVGKAWSLSAKTLTSRLTFEYRFPDAGCRFSLQSMVAVAPNIDGYILQAEHWRVQLVVTPVITVREDNGNTLSVDVANLAEVLLMK